MLNLEYFRMVALKVESAKDIFVNILNCVFTKTLPRSYAQSAKMHIHGIHSLFFAKKLNPILYLVFRDQLVALMPVQSSYSAKVKPQSSKPSYLLMSV